jgi:hypothetical protein
MRSSMIELLYVKDVYNKIYLTKTKFISLDISALTLNDLLNELNTVDKCKLLLEQYFLLHYLVFIRGCECSPILANYRIYLENFINQLNINQTDNINDRYVVEESKIILDRVKHKISLYDWIPGDFIKLNNILDYNHLNESTIYTRMIDLSVIIPLANFFEKRPIFKEDDVTPQCLAPLSLTIDKKLTIQSVSQNKAHMSLSIGFQLIPNIVGYDIAKALNFKYYDIIAATIPSTIKIPLVSSSEKTVLTAMQFLTGFIVTVVDTGYMLPEWIVVLGSSIEPYLKTSWVDFFQWYILHNQILQLQNHISDHYALHKTMIYISLVFAALIYRVKTQTGISKDNLSLLHELSSFLNCTEHISTIELIKTYEQVSEEQMALTAESPIKQLLHSMVLKYRFLDEEEEDENSSLPDAETLENNHKSQGYTISEQPVEPILPQDNNNNQNPDESSSSDDNNEDEPPQIVDPTLPDSANVSVDQPESDNQNNNKNPYDSSPPDDSLLTEEATRSFNQDTQQEDIGPLFEFIKEPCTLNELFYKRKVANIIFKILQNSPKGLVKEQLKALEYWYRKLLFLVDVASTKRFIKIVLSEYKQSQNK